jgi:hypothetical protein
MKFQGGYFDRSITKNQRRSKDFFAATIRVPQSFYSRLPTKRAAYHPLEHLNQLVKDALVIVPSGSAGATARWQHRPMSRQASLRCP